MSKKNYRTKSNESLAAIQLETDLQTTAQSTYALAERDAFKGRITAAMAKQIMDNVAALSSVESHYMKLAPGGAEQYRSIVQTYTRLALLRMIGGESND